MGEEKSLTIILTKISSNNRASESRGEACFHYAESSRLKRSLNASLLGVFLDGSPFGLEPTEQREQRGRLAFTMPSREGGRRMSHPNQNLKLKSNFTSVRDKPRRRRRNTSS